MKAVQISAPSVYNFGTCVEKNFYPCRIYLYAIKRAAEMKG